MKTNSRWRLAVRAVLYISTLTAVVGCVERRAETRGDLDAPQVAVTPQPAPAQSDPRDILMRMAAFLAQTPRFSVSLNADYDVLQASGQMIEFAETRRILVNRPSGLRVEVEHSDGEKHLVVYDGAAITAFSPAENVYAQVARPGGIDQAVIYFLRDLHMRLPLAALLLSRFPAEIESRTLSLDYVERTSIDGTPAHHLAGRTETVDYQIWIAERAQPLPLRAVLTYKNAEGHPQFRADFADWNLAPVVQASQFAFTPPRGARKIAFVAQMPAVEFRGASTAAAPGEPK